jgi:predicted thioesterase
MRKPAVILAVLESKQHEVNAIKSGIKMYRAGNVEFEEREPGEFWVAVEDKNGRCGGMILFTRDGRDLEHYFCNCGVAQGGALCKHIVAGVLAIQGGVPDTTIILGKTATAETIVTEHNTAKAVGSGSLDVFATPMMIALMESAACKCLSDALDVGQTSVGTHITVDHTAASPIGMKITATATIAFVHGRAITFEVAACDGTGEIGKGTHNRVIVDAEKFEARTKKNAKNS